MGYAIFQNRNAVDGYGTGLVIVARADTDSRTGIVYELVVRTAPAYGCVGSRCNIGRLKGVGTAHGRF